MRTVSLLPLLLALLAGCGGAPNANPPARQIPASVLRAQLTYYDRAIAALRAGEAAWSDRARAAEIASDRTQDLAAFHGAAVRLAAIERQRSTDSSDENAALGAVSSGGIAAGAAIARYRTDLLANERAAIAAAQRDAQRRIADGVALRRQQLYESVATLALQLTRRDAAQTMLLRLRATEVGSDPRARARARARLAAVADADRARLAALSAHNDGVLAAYRAQLAAATDAQEARTIAQIRRRTRANLSARSLVQAPPASLERAVAAMRSSAPASFAQVSTTAQSFGEARRRASSRFATLASVDANAARALAVQIAQLQRERARVYDAIAASSARTRHQSSSASSTLKTAAIQ